MHLINHEGYRFALQIYMGQLKKTGQTIHTETEQTKIRKGLSLDAKIAARKAKDPKFQQRMREAAKGFMPLTQTDDGKLTVTSLRIAAGLTQSELAQQTNSRQPNISALEAGQRDNPNRETMRLLCAALACDMNTLDMAIENSKAMLAQFNRK